MTVDAIVFDSAQFKRKLFRSLAVIAHALRTARRPYIAYSGGKDSLAVCALVHTVRDDVPLLWSDDELEYPEVVEHMTALQHVAGDQLIVTLGWARHAGWFDPWTQRPYFRSPLLGAIRIDQNADDWMGARRYDLTFTGLRAEESRRRRDFLLRVTAENRLPLYPVSTGTGHRCCPIWNWTNADVWALIHGWNLPVACVYDRLSQIGVSREHQRVGPLPLARRDHLADGWPTLLKRLEQRYGNRWD